MDIYTKEFKEALVDELDRVFDIKLPNEDIESVESAVIDVAKDDGYNELFGILTNRNTDDA